MNRIVHGLKAITLAPVTGRQWAALVAVLAAFVWLYFFLAAILIAETNQNRLSSDQQHNINLAAKQVGHVVPYYTEGIVNPLWPWMASKFRSDDDSVTFVRGKWVNVSLSAAFLVGLGLVSARFLPLLATVNLVLLAGLGGLLNRAVFFQPEPLSYMMLFACWVLSLVLLVRNPLWLYVVLGLLAGVAYLAKSSVSPMLVVFVGVSGLQWLWVMWQSRQATQPAEPGMWCWRRHVVGLLLLVGCFALPVIPRAVYSQQQFGSPLHSWPKYWMWQDDFGTESVPFMAANGSREKLDALTADEKPSAANYFASHSGAEAWQRLTSGVGGRLGELLLPERKIKKHREGKPWKKALRYRGGYLLGLMALAVVLAACAWRARWREFLSPPVVSLLLFVMGAFVLYTMAYGWYYQIGRGERFMMALFLPLVGSLLWAANRLQSGAPQWSFCVRWVFMAAQVVLLLVLGNRVVELLVFPVFVG